MTTTETTMTKLYATDLDTLEYMAHSGAQIEGGGDDIALCSTSHTIKQVTQHSVARLLFGGYIKEIARLGSFGIYAITETGRESVNQEQS